MTAATLRPEPRAVTPEIPFGSRMHEASLQALEATTKRTSGKAALSWSGLGTACWRIIFLPVNVPVNLIKLIGSFNETQCFKQGNRVNRHNYG